MIKDALNDFANVVVASSINEDACKIYDELPVKPKLTISAEFRRFHTGDRVETAKLLEADFDDASEALQWFSKIQYLYSVAPEATLEFVHPKTQLLYTVCELMYYMTRHDNET